MRRVGPVLGLVVLAASLVIGTDLFGAREALFGSATPAPRAAAFSRVDGSRAAVKTVLRSQPWWQQLGRYEGDGAGSTRAFRVTGDAIQWRVRWSCRRGRFVARASAGSEPLIDAPCSGDMITELIEKVDGGLQIETEGPWTARVEQQVDVPLVEPPLPGMSAPGTREVATGSFYRIDQVGRGRLAFYRLADGRHLLRLRGFYVTPNIDLEIQLHPLRSPKTTRDYLSRPAKKVALLPITAGSMNFVVPKGVDPSRYASVVIWCPLITSAYAAATLHPVA